MTKNVKQNAAKPAAKAAAKPEAVEKPNTVGVIASAVAKVATAHRRLAPTRTEQNTARPDTATKPTLKPVRVKRADGARTNAALISFPTDRYGLTTDVKRAFITAASRIAGDEGKLALFGETVELLMQHVQVKVAQDAENRKARNLNA